MYRPITAACAVLALAACATPTVYAPAQPATSARATTSVGFSEYRIENNRYRVTFQGGSGAPEALVTDYAFLRAAEITLRDGYDWFQVVDRFGERTGSGYGGPRMSVGVGGGDYGRHSAYGVGIGTSFPLGGGSGSGGAYSRTIEIVLGKGAKPANPDVYDARQVAAAIAPNAPTARY